MAITATPANVQVKVGAVQHAFDGVRDSYRRWVKYRETARALSGLSARELADIGVEMSADEFAWQLANKR